MRARRIPPAFNNSLMGASGNGTRMCKACKEASQSVVFSRPLDFMEAKSTRRKAPGMVACPRCGTLWHAANVPGALATAPHPASGKKA